MTKQFNETMLSIFVNTVNIYLGRGPYYKSITLLYPVTLCLEVRVAVSELPSQVRPRLDEDVRTPLTMGSSPEAVPDVGHLVVTG